MAKRKKKKQSCDIFAYWYLGILFVMFALAGAVMASR